MVISNIVELLNQCYTKLTKSEKKIANYLYNNLLDAQFMSITSLAETCGVADATIYRFCRSLGFNGYNEFKLSLAKSFMQSEISDDGRVVSSYGQVSPDDPFTDMCKKLYNTNVSAIVQTMEQLNEQDVRRAVDILLSAGRVYCIGQGGSQIVAMAAWSRFVSISPNFFCVQDSHLQAITASLLSGSDALIIFSYSGATRDMMDILPLARENGVKVILVTHYKNSPGAEYADIVIICESNEGPLQVGSVAAKIAQLFIIDVLFNEFWLRNPKKASRCNDITSAATARKLL